eukprot:6207365-Pleurochrysis_carterae.AAC.2
MSAAGTAHLKEQLQESLALFYAFEQMSTGISELIRAIYKEIHHEGNYAKGKGRREFMPWLLENHGGAPSFPLERADGGRQDLHFDGAVPIFLNRSILVAFLKSLVF